MTLNTLQAQQWCAGDGASSAIRGQLGIKLDGDSNLQHLINIHFHSPSLAARLRQKPAMLFFVFSHDVILILVAHNLDTGVDVSQPLCTPVSVQTSQAQTQSACT